MVQKLKSYKNQPARFPLAENLLTVGGVFGESQATYTTQIKLFNIKNFE